MFSILFSIQKKMLHFSKVWLKRSKEILNPKNTGFILFYYLLFFKPAFARVYLIGKTIMKTSVL
jgi:hypothetical protein